WEGGGRGGGGGSGLFEVELFERAKDVGAELDAGADLAEFGRLLQHPHGKTLARERVGRRQAPDAAARNQDRQGLTVRHRHSTNVRKPPANILSPFRNSFNCVPYALPLTDASHTHPHPQALSASAWQAWVATVRKPG